MLSNNAAHLVPVAIRPESYGLCASSSSRLVLEEGWLRGDGKTPRVLSLPPSLQILLFT